MLTRRGFTLVELLVALALAGVVSTAVLRALMLHQRTARDQARRIGIHQTLRAAEAILAAELRELDAADGDLVALSPTSVTIRATRQLAFLCAPPAGGPGAVTLTVRQDLLFGVRAFNAATDSLFLYHEGAPNAMEDDGWVRAALSRDPASSVCPDGTPGMRLVADLRFDALQTADGIPSGAPVRGFEPVTYSLYRSGDGTWNLGIQTRGGGPRQPVVGPFRGADGIAFAYLNAEGMATARPEEVAEIHITLRAGKDSLVTAVSLRNNRRR